MTHDNVATKSKSNFIISSVALLFCLVWALVGEAEIKIVPVTIAFICFLKTGIETEMDSRAKHASH